MTLMAKRKKDDSGGSKRKSSGNSRAWGIASAAAGGAVGAVGAVLATRVGVEPKTAVLAVTATGVAGAVFASGNLRWGSAGMLAAGASQLAVGWLQKKTAEATAAQAAQAAAAIGGGGPRQGLPGDVAQAFREAREQMEDDYAN
jgi:hypothetical protein